jgi:hypothetical protein
VRDHIAGEAVSEAEGLHVLLGVELVHAGLARANRNAKRLDQSAAGPVVVAV